jgi:DNA-binding NarL/FixJ family response regulator
VLERHDDSARHDPDPVIRLMIIDRHVMLARGLAMGLSQFAGMEVVATANGRVEGLALARELRPEVILLEATAHDGETTATVQELRRLLPRGSVLVLAGQVSAPFVARCIMAGASGVIGKESDLPTLERALRACARGESMVIAEQLVPDVRRWMRETAAGIPRHLTAREREVLGLLDTGLDATQIAERLGIAQSTARNHIQNVLMKLGAHSKLEAVAVARRSGLLPA